MDIRPAESPAAEWTLSAEDLFDKSEMLAVNLIMPPAFFRLMAAENRFSPEQLSSEKVRRKAFEYFDGTQAFPNFFNWYAADIFINGVPIRNVGIRQKGFLGSDSWPVPGLKIRTDKNIAGQNIAGEEYLTFNNASADWIRFRTCLTFELFAAADYPAPLCNLAKVDLNGEPLGIYVHVEPIKESFLRRNFGNDTGSLYEGMVAGMDINYLARFEVKTDHTDPKKMALIALIEALDSPDEELIQNLSEHLNIDLFITFWALEMVSNHIDGYSGNQNNFYIYFDPADDNRAVFIPWGVDAAFAMSGDPSVFTSYYFLKSRIPSRLADIPEMRQQMEAEVNRIVDEAWNTDAILDSINSYESLIIDNGEYYSQPMDMEQDYREMVEELRLFTRERPETVLENLELMFGLADEASVSDIETVNQLSGNQVSLFVKIDWGKLWNENQFNGSGWTENLFSRVRADMRFLANENPEDWGEMMTDGSLEASPIEWFFAIFVVSDALPNFIIITLALIVLALTAIFRRIF